MSSPTSLDRRSRKHQIKLFPLPRFLRLLFLYSSKASSSSCASFPVFTLPLHPSVSTNVYVWWGGCLTQALMMMHTQPLPLAPVSQRKGEQQLADATTSSSSSPSPSCSSVPSGPSTTSFSLPVPAPSPRPSCIPSALRFCAMEDTAATMPTTNATSAGGEIAQTDHPDFSTLLSSTFSRLAPPCLPASSSSASSPSFSFSPSSALASLGHNTLPLARLMEWLCAVGALSHSFRLLRHTALSLLLQISQSAAEGQQEGGGRGGEGKLPVSVLEDYLQVCWVVHSLPVLALRYHEDEAQEEESR